MKKITLLLGAVLLCLPAASRAEEEAGRKGPCKADYEKFCKDVKPGEGRIIACMKEHEADLSDECKARIAKAKEKFKEAKADFDKACGDDVKSLCADVKPGHGALMKCLAQNKDKVSEGCKSFMAEKKEKRKKWRERRAARKAGAEGGSEKSGGDKDDDGGGSDQ